MEVQHVPTGQTDLDHGLCVNCTLTNLFSGIIYVRENNFYCLNPLISVIALKL